jgi:3-hydroxyisobutyrate dehydrogenase-like beta-hydroxyacid dehydrogenase
MTIGFLGLGQMGAAIAANALKAYPAMAVWNRSPGKADALMQDGAVLAGSPRDLGERCEIVVTMLADDAALEAVLTGEDGLLAGLKQGGLHVSLSTIAVATSDRVAALHAERGQAYVAAPVFGRPDVAASAQLSIVAAGASADIDRAALLFDAIGKRVFRIGDTPSAANLVKLCGNFMILSAVEAMAEAMTLAEKGGVAKQQLLEVLTGTLFDAPVYRNYGAILAEDRYRPAGFTAPLGLKDMKLVGAAAEATRTPMPLLSLLRDHLMETMAKEGEDIDWSGIALTVAKNAGLPDPA